MPTYGYRCSNCGHQFEIVQRISDEPLKVCPKCQGKLSKMLYPVGISFKGSGFYT
ncbi:MAG TPA: FmdB family zinc ribbon protein, partial [Candidatus Dormibacteraeota bacterium]|nr:FmdB family zinc ribbon protein [Candidatus Dormibacteraeota bacterium]